MAAFGWKKQASVLEWLYAEPWAFDFFQAVRLLERIRSRVYEVGAAPAPSHEAVVFKSSPALDFPASEIRDLTPGDPATMVVSFFGLAGPQGPLPLPDTERILERTWYKDTAFRDFLDIFNHRLIGLMYQVRKLHRPALTPSSPDRAAVARWLYSVLGLGVPSLRDRMQVQDRALLFYAGILSQHPRSAVGLARILSDYYGVHVDVVQFRGAWRALDESDHTRLGRTGQNQVLGTTAVVGRRFWDQAGRCDVVLGPLRLGYFLDLLPDGRGYRPLCELVRFYTGPQFEYRFRLVLRAGDVPETRLGTTKLGWTSWLKTRPFRSDDDQVRFAPRG